MPIRSISDVLTGFQAKLQANQTLQELRIHNILEEFHERGFGFILLIIALPMALPLPVPPGVNIALASPLLLLTAQQALGRHTIWLPQTILNKTVSASKLDTVLSSFIPWMKRLEAISKPRLAPITRGGFSNLIGIMGFIMALSVCIPLPLTNTVPSLGIALMALGVIMRDGLAVIAGMVIGIGWVMMLILVITFLGTEGIEIIRDFIKSFL
jgi:hypothetical protein